MRDLHEFIKEDYGRNVRDWEHLKNKLSDFKIGTELQHLKEELTLCKYPRNTVNRKDKKTTTKQKSAHQTTRTTQNRQTSIRDTLSDHTCRDCVKAPRTYARNVKYKLISKNG